MKQISAFLMDFASEHLLAEQLAQILSSSAEPSFAITRAREEDCTIVSAAGSLSAKMNGNAPALLLFTFERFPSDEIVVSLLERSRRTCNGRGFFLVMQTASAHEVAHLLNLGVADVWQAPLRAAEVLGRLLHWLKEVAPLEVDRPIQALKARLGLDQFIGESPALLDVIQKIRAIAGCPVPVLIRGETGTGKDVCARAIHDLSRRSGQPFVPVNCGALPLDLMENELFGHRPGAFTGANAVARGLIEQANGGTLFLGEIDSLPPPAQVKLLRFLQDKEVRPLGSTTTRTADVRLLAATNADLEEAVRTGRFRQDLYYRLRVVELTLPALRERAGDVELLAYHFLKNLTMQYGKVIHAFTPDATRMLSSHHWPGNVRELENVVARAVALCQQSMIQAKDIVVLSQPELHTNGSTFRALKAEAIRTFEKDYLVKLLQIHHGNISHAALAAGKARPAFWQLLRKHGLTTAVALTACSSS